ncbi:uncharacterized protein LOC115761306 [Drosophila novamexicana]|uniref:uncharacterized protein LOC115761306 n=1 Tax=Drosophila novamexicana TaxID=47314 RepID=UPI0011E5BFD4|nr:uncharacterized protein LOC115761306 [Drosophila novamexicana]
MEPLKQSYSFDIILLNSSRRPREGEENPFTYSIRLFNEFVELPQNRLFTQCFPSKALGKFVASPCELVGSLTTKGICVTMYEGEQMYGCGNCRLSPPVLRQLADPTFSVNEVLSVELQKNKKRMATVDINIKFSSTDPDLDTRLLPFGCYDVCRPLDKSVNPRDVIFTLGRSGRCAATSCITDERLMTHAGAPFSCMHKKSQPTGEECGCILRGVKPPPELDPTKDRERTLLKKLLIDLDIDKVHVPTPPSGHERSRRCKCPKYPSSSDSGTFNSSDGWLSEWDDQQKQPPSIFESAFTPEQLEALDVARKHTLGVCPVIKQPELMTTKYTPPLLCPVCHANITWLPKVAACPYCGYKRFEMDKPSEEPFDESATAAEVLRNHMLRTRLSSEENSQRKHNSYASIPKNSKDCTCRTSRVCTRCRIQELCDQMLSKSSTTKIKSQPQSQSQEQIRTPRKTASTPSQRRNQLLKIFTDMHDVYSDKRTPKQLTEKLLKDCEAIACKAKKKGRRRQSTAIKCALKDLKTTYPLKKRKPKCVKKAKRRIKSKRYTFLVRKDNSRQPSTHHTCSRGSGRVPCHMGWMWTESELARHRCWKPGAIKKSIRQLMAYFLRDYPADKIGNSRFHYRRRRQSSNQPVEEEPLIQHPTLHITKKYDEYTITLRPLKDAKSLAVDANPYANMKPVVFRIIKDPITTGMRNIKISLKDKGYPVCSCHQPVASCFCRSHVDQKIVAQEVKLLSEERGWRDVSDIFVYSDLSESDSDNELEFGVTPPAGVVKPERRRKPDRVNCETQYNENDWAMPTQYPHPASALVQYGGCVLGERKARFPWIMGKGFVHREPKPPKMINKPKTEKKTKGRLKGGYDGGTFEGGYNPLQGKRVWHKSNKLESGTFYNYNPGSTQTR